MYVYQDMFIKDKTDVGVSLEKFATQKSVLIGSGVTFDGSATTKVTWH